MKTYRDSIMFFLGMMCAYLIQFSYEQSINYKNIIFLVAFPSILLLLKWIMKTRQRTFIANWTKYKQKGRFNFIIINYVILYGLIFYTGLFAFIMHLKFETTALIVLSITSVLVAIFFAIIGNTEWNKCELEYQKDIAKEIVEKVYAKK